MEDARAQTPNLTEDTLNGLVAFVTPGATRTAEKIFTRYFGGDPWVRREAPVSSIDDRVTAAVMRRGLGDVPRRRRAQRAASGSP